MAVELDTDEHPELSANIVLGEVFPGIFNIVYVDGDFETTRRTVERCRLAAFANWSYLSAFCRMRQAERLFRLDRIAEMANADTGEVVVSVLGKPLAGLAALKAARLKELNADLNVLTFVATLSAGLRDSQIAIVAAYLTGQGGDSEDLARRIKRHDAPNPVAFREWIKRVPPERTAPLRQAAAAVLAKTKRNGDLDRGVLLAIDKWSIKPAVAAVTP